MEKRNDSWDVLYDGIADIEFIQIKLNEYKRNLIYQEDKLNELEEENKRLRKIVDIIEKNSDEYRRRKELDPFNEEKWDN